MILNDISYVQVVPVDLYFSFAQTYFIICIGLMVMILYPRNSQYTGIELSTGVVFEKGVKPCGFYILQLVCPSCIKKTTSETFLLLHLVIYVKLEQQSL